MTHIDESAHPDRPSPTSLSEMHLGQGSNDRDVRRLHPTSADTIPPESNIRAEAAANERFYASTEVMWEDWEARMDAAVAGGGVVGDVLPMPARVIEKAAAKVAAAARERERVAAAPVR